MSKKQTKPETLEQALKDMMRHIRCISILESEIDEKWGVRIKTGFIHPSDSRWDETAECWVRRGLEEIEKALGKEAKTSVYSRYARELKHYGVRFTQSADDRTKVFVKAGCQPPKVRIVEDTEDGQENKD